MEPADDLTGEIEVRTFTDARAEAEQIASALHQAHRDGSALGRDGGPRPVGPGVDSTVRAGASRRGHPRRGGGRRDPGRGAAGGPGAAAGRARRGGPRVGPPAACPRRPRRSCSDRWAGSTRRSCARSPASCGGARGDRHRGAARLPRAARRVPGRAGVAGGGAPRSAARIGRGPRRAAGDRAGPARPTWCGDRAPAEQVLWELWDGTDWPRRLQSTAESGDVEAHRDLDALVALFDDAARAEESGRRAEIGPYIDVTARPADPGRLARRARRPRRRRARHDGAPLEGAGVGARRRRRCAGRSLARHACRSQPAAHRAARPARRRPAAVLRSVAGRGAPAVLRRRHAGAPTPARHRGREHGVRRGAAVALRRRAAAVQRRAARTPARSSPPAGIAARRRGRAARPGRDRLHRAGASRGRHPPRRAVRRRLRRPTPTGGGAPPTSPGPTSRCGPVAEPLALSGSAVDGITGCALRWFLSREVKGEQGTTTAQGFGLALHVLAAEVVDAVTPDVDADDVDRPPRRGVAPARLRHTVDRRPRA